MVIEDSVRCTNYCFPITLWIPSDADARLNVIGVGLNALLQSQIVVASQCQRCRRLEPRRKFHVIAHTIVQCKVRTNAPRILPENAERLVREGIVWIAHFFNEVSGKV